MIRAAEINREDDKTAKLRDEIASNTIGVVLDMENPILFFKNDRYDRSGRSENENDSENESGSDSDDNSDHDAEVDRKNDFGSNDNGNRSNDQVKNKNVDHDEYDSRKVAECILNLLFNL